MIVIDFVLYVVNDNSVKKEVKKLNKIYVRRKCFSRETDVHDLLLCENNIE